MKDNIRYNVIANIIRTVAMTLLSFISFPFVCNKLGDASLGTYTWANTFVYYFLILAKLGVPNVAIRECAKVKDDKEALSKKAQEFFIIQGVLTLLSFGLMCLIIFTAKGDLFENKELIFILSINFLVGVFSFEWIYIALEKHFYISFRSIVILAFSSILIILFVRHKEDTYLYAFLSILGTILTIISNLIFLPRFITFKKIGKYNFKQYFKSLIFVFGISFVLTLYNQSDTFILGIIDPSKSEVGSYSVGIKAIDIVITIITSLSAVFIPRATMLYQKQKYTLFDNLTKYAFNICLFIAIPAIVTLILLSKEITLLISGNSTEGYAHAPMALIILASMILTYSISDMIYSQVLLPMQKERIYFYVMMVGSVLNISASIGLGFLFKDSPIVGIAIATMACDLIILFSLLILTKKYTFKSLFNVNSLKLLIAGALLTVSTILIKTILASYSSILVIFTSIFIGAIVYLLTLLLLKENLVSSFKKSKPATN